MRTNITLFATVVPFNTYSSVESTWAPEYIYQEIERCDSVIQLTIVKQCKPFSKNRKAFTTNLSMSFKEVFGERENAKKFTTVMNREGRGRSL